MHTLPEIGELQGVIAGGFPTAEEVRLYELGKTLRDGNLTSLDAFLGRLVTLDTALIGGGFAAAKGDALPLWVCIPVVILLLASLAVALDALRPRKYDIDFSVVEQLSCIETMTLNRKKNQMAFAGAAFVTAVSLAVVGFVIHAVRSL